MTLTGKVFKAYQKKEGSEEYESISTVDFYKEIEPIKVLNVYPTRIAYDVKIPPQTVKFEYSNGTTANLPKSSMLKVWMEGGKINETLYEAYGKNPITGEQLLNITPVSSDAFNANPETIWDYDMFVFGFWDGNGGIEDQPNDKAVEELEKYIQSGHGILTGHDSLGLWNYNIGFNKLRKYFNIEIGIHPRYRPSDNSFVDYPSSYWFYRSNKVKVEKNGLLTNFPYELSLGKILEVPITHMSSQASKGNVWMTMTNGEDYAGSRDNYYNAGGTGNPEFYLTTYNNTAMIQTGSTTESAGEATDDEKKVLANTLFYLKQRTTATSFTDNSSQDLKAPNAPTIKAKRNNIKKEIELLFNSEDNGSTYSFYVEALDENDTTNVIDTSNTRTETVTTGTKGYYYIIDTDSSNKDFDTSTAIYVEDDSAIIGMENNEKYIHIKAVDVAGNISESSVNKIKILELNSKVNLELADGKGGVELDWKGYDIANKYFVIYRKEESEETFSKIVVLEDKLCADEYTDILGNDKAKPISPTVDVGTNLSDIQINLYSSDNGTTYTYYVEAYDSTTSEILAISNTQTIKI